MSSQRRNYQQTEKSSMNHRQHNSVNGGSSTSSSPSPAIHPPQNYTRNNNTSRRHNSKQRKREPRGNTTMSTALTAVASDSPRSPPRNGLDITHLLEFTFPPRQAPPSSTYRARRLLSSRSFDSFRSQERYVGANFRFILRPDTAPDIHAHIANVDQVIPWENVLSVVVPVVAEERTCAICLDKPLAPRITKCGHVYCLGCWLHFVHLDNKKQKWCSCPVCASTVYANDLRHCVIQQLESIDVGIPRASSRDAFLHDDTLFEKQFATRDMEMRLMMRDVNFSVVVPADLSSPTSTALSTLPRASTFGARFVRIAAGNYGDFERALEDELHDLANNGVGEVDQDPEEGKWRQIAMEHIVLESSRISKPNKSQNRTKAKDSNTTKEKERQLTSPVSSTASSPAASSSPAMTSKTFYFYQACDGSHTYLHPLDIKLLKEEYGDYSSFPSTLKVRVIAKAETTVVEDVRRRHRVLAHLPLGCDVTILECDWTHCDENANAQAPDAVGVVKPTTIKKFEKELSSRRRKLEQQRHQQYIDFIEAATRAETSSFLLTPEHSARAAASPQPLLLDDVEAFPIATPASPVSSNSALPDFGPGGAPLARLNFAKAATNSRNRPLRMSDTLLARRLGAHTSSVGPSSVEPDEEVDEEAAKYLYSHQAPIWSLDLDNILIKDDGRAATLSSVPSTAPEPEGETEEEHEADELEHLDDFLPHAFGKKQQQQQNSSSQKSQRKKTRFVKVAGNSSTRRI